jgi:hypothetical protein
MKRDRGRLNSRTRETRTYSLTNALSGRFTRHASHAFNAHNGIDRVVGRAGCRPAPGRPGAGAARTRARSRVTVFVISPVRPVLSTFNFTSKAVQNRLEGHRTGVHINTVPTARGTRAIPFRRTFPGHRTSGIQQCVCLVSCHGSPRCFQTGIPVSTRLINRHGVTMKSRNFPQLCVCSHASVTNSVPAA